MTFGEKLQRQRKKNGLSQEQLAERLSVSRQAISKWELGAAVPNTENVVQISRVLGVSLDYLLKEECEEDAPAAENRPEKKPTGLARTITGSVMAGLGAIGLLVIGIMASVFPATLYEPRTGSVRKIVMTGFPAFLVVNNIIWLFVLCCALTVCGAVIALWPGIKKYMKKMNAPVLM